MPPPDQLAPIIDAVIEHALRGAPVPEQLPTLIEWYETEWDYDLFNWYPEYFAVSLKTLDFADGNLDVSGTILDSHRTQFARELIDYSLNCDEFNPIVHSVRVANRDGEQAILGWLIVVAGQHGNFYHFQGIFRDTDAYYEFLRQHDYVLNYEPERVTDETILRLWSYDT